MRLTHGLILVAVLGLAGWTPVTPPRAQVHADLDADINHDGVIDNLDRADNGRAQDTPPGLQVVAGEMAELVLRCTPLARDYGKVTLAVEFRGTGRIRVWEDPTKKTLVLGGDKGTTHSWFLSKAMPFGALPAPFYVELTEKSSFPGDILMTLRYLTVDSDRTPESGGDMLLITGVEKRGVFAPALQMTGAARPAADAQKK